MNNILKKISCILTKKIISKYKPFVIGITGSVGKTSTKEAIYSVVSSRFSVAKTKQNFNNELGVPLTVLMADVDIEYKKADLNFMFWLKVFFHALNLILFKSNKYPQYLVIEMGADKKGDIKYLTDMVSPKIAVITMIGDIPSHIEFFEDIEDLAIEKSQLVKSLPDDGIAILNYDDTRVLNMKDSTNADIITYGFDPVAHFRAHNVKYFFDGDMVGLEFDLHYQTNRQLVRVSDTVAKHQIYPILSAISIGVFLGIDISTIINSFKNIEIPSHRMSMIKNDKGVMIIDDCYNASPISMKSAIDALYDLDMSIDGSGKKIAILGDMLELGDYEIMAHKMIGAYLKGKVDILITIGDRAKYISDEAKEFLSDKNIYHFMDKQEVLDFIKNVIKPKDLLLVKASRGMALESIVEGLK